MTSTPKPREFVWVPEDCVFESAPDCLEKFPDAGPACMFPTPTAYQAALDRVEEIRDARKLLNERTRCLDIVTKERDLALKRAERAEAQNQRLRVDSKLNALNELRDEYSTLREKTKKLVVALKDMCGNRCAEQNPCSAKETIREFEEGE